MKLNKTKNTQRNIAYGLLNRVFTLLFPFVVRTFLIRYLGIQYAGLNSLFSSILQVLNLTELGFGSAVVYSMYKPIAENDEDSICALLNFYRRVYAIVGTIIFAVGLLLIPILPHLINGGYPADIDLYKLYIIYLINTCLSYWLFGYKNSLLNAHQRTDVLSKISSLTQGGLCLCQIVLLIVTRNYYVNILLMPFFTIANNLIIASVTKRVYPQYVCRGKPNKKQRKDINKKVSGLLVHKLCLTSRNTFDNILISAFLGLTITGLYGNYYTIMSSVVGFMAVMTSAMLAGVGNSIQTETTEKNYGDFLKFNFLYMWISGWCTVCLLCLYQPFMKIWMGAERLLPYSIVVLFCIYFFVLKMGDIRSVYLEAAGLWWENRYRAIIEALINLVLNFVLGKIFGLHGIIIATLIPLFFINFIGGSYVVFEHYFKNGKTGVYFRTQIKYAVCTFAVAALTYGICSFIHFGVYTDLIFRAMICLLLPNLLFFLLYRRTPEYSVAKQWIINKLPEKVRRCIV